MAEDNEINVKSAAESFFAQESTADAQQAAYEAGIQQLAADLAQSGSNKASVSNVKATGGGGGPKTDENDTKLTELEQSLVNFLSRRKEIDKMVAGGARRLRSLTLGVNVKDAKPFFTVQIGVCEAAFNLENGGKERGSCYGIERFVKTWFESGSVAAELQKFAAKKAEDIKKRR